MQQGHTLSTVHGPGRDHLNNRLNFILGNELCCASRSIKAAEENICQLNNR